MKYFISNKFTGVLQLFGTVALIVVLWELLRNVGLFKKELLPNSFEISNSFLNLLGTKSFWIDLSSSLFRTFYGLILACIIGIPLGFFIGSNKYLRPVGLPFIDFLRSIPVTSLYPVFVLTLGINNRGKIGMIFLGSVLVILLHTIMGFENRSRLRHFITKLYGAPKVFIYFKVILNETLPNIITGVRVSIGYALIISTLTEMFMGAANGIGQSLMEAYSIYNLSEMYAYIFVLGVVGYFFNQVFALIENKTSEWRKR